MVCTVYPVHCILLGFMGISLLGWSKGWGTKIRHWGEWRVWSVSLTCIWSCRYGASWFNMLTNNKKLLHLIQNIVKGETSESFRVWGEQTGSYFRKYSLILSRGNSLSFASQLVKTKSNIVYYICDQIALEICSFIFMAILQSAAPGTVVICASGVSAILSTPLLSVSEG